MVVAALFEQIIPSHRGLTREGGIADNVANDDQVWQYQAMEPSSSQPFSMITSLPMEQQRQKVTSVTPTTAATRKRRKRCKATKCLASLAADFDVITDWTFYFHCRNEDRKFRAEYQQNPDPEKPPYMIPPVLLWVIFIVCLIGSVLWLTMATDGRVATPLLRLLGYDKISMGYVLFLCVIVEDLPQVVLTFLVEDYFEEDGNFNNYALVNVIASLYDTLIKLAEAFDERADVVETGIWCKESLRAHKKKVCCVVPIPIDETDDDMFEKTNEWFPSPNLPNNSFSQMRTSSSRMHIASLRTNTQRGLLEEAREIVSETKLPRLRFLSSSKDQTIRLWDTNAKLVGRQLHTCVRTFRGHTDSVSCIAFLYILDKKRLSLLEHLNETRHPTVVDSKSLPIARGPAFFLTGSYDGSIKLWKSESSRCCQSYEVRADAEPQRDVKVMCIAFLGAEDSEPQRTSSSSSSLLGKGKPQEVMRDIFVSGYKSGKIRMWNVLTGTCLAVLTGHPSKVQSICKLKRCDNFASASEDSTIKIWSSHCMHNAEKRDDSRLDETCKWSSSSRDPVRIMIGHKGPVLSVACVSQHVLLTGGEDRTARIWNTENGVCLRVFVGHTEAVTSVAIVDNVTFLTGSKDTTVKVWDGLSASCIRTYTGHTAGVTSVSTTFQTGTFISASDDLTVKLWVFTAVLPIVSNDDHGTLNDLLGLDHSLACMMNCVDSDPEESAKRLRQS